MEYIYLSEWMNWMIAVVYLFIYIFSFGSKSIQYTIRCNMLFSSNKDIKKWMNKKTRL